MTERKERIKKSAGPDLSSEDEDDFSFDRTKDTFIFHEKRYLPVLQSSTPCDVNDFMNCSCVVASTDVFMKRNMKECYVMLNSTVLVIAS